MIKKFHSIFSVLFAWRRLKNFFIYFYSSGKKTLYKKFTPNFQIESNIKNLKLEFILENEEGFYARKYNLQNKKLNKNYIRHSFTFCVDKINPFRLVKTFNCKEIILNYKQIKRACKNLIFSSFFLRLSEMNFFVFFRWKNCKTLPFR